MAIKNDNRSNILFRYGFVVFWILVLSACIVVQLAETTVVNAEKWNHKADSLLSMSQDIIPRRGNILASDGSVLATNLNYYTARIDYRAEKFNVKKLRENIDELSEALAANFPEKDAAKWKHYLLKPLEKEKDRRPRAYRILTNLSHADMELLKTLPYFKGNRNRTGLYFEKNMRRFNPYGNMARRSIGGVGETSESKEIHGISGLEKALDSLLYGRTGTTRKVNLTKDIADLAKIPAIPGCDIVTTIDIGMQDIVESELNNVLDSCGADWGVAVLMDVRTGDIKAISNLELNPNGPGYIEARNRAVMGYEPGSVIKTLSMMIAVEDGIVNELGGLDRVLPTGNGWAYAGGRPITDSHHTTGIRVGDVIEQSSNIGMARIITSRYDSNPGGFYSRIKEIGFLEPLNTGIAGEVVPRVDSVPSDRGGRIALSRQCYGYATEIPPLYTLALYNAIANDGVFVRPRLVKELRGSVDSVLQPSYLGNGRACSPQTAAVMREMLTNVVWGEHGTGRFLRNQDVRIAGKTGTCYMIENGQYNTGKKRLAFCGFFPAEAPMFSCVVLTCHPTKNFFGAATTSGQVMRNIAMKLYSRGMLGNSSDYNTSSPSSIGPTFYASVSGNDPYRHLRTPFALPNRKSIKGPKTSGPGVPDVRGLSAREAVDVLESNGYDVTISGSGFVNTQTPSPRSAVSPSHTVHLSLSR